MKLNRNNAGFTLIELMIVVAIIAIIASVAIPRLMAARLAANESAAVSTLRSLSSAQAQLQSSGAIDSDADGGGEYGYFGELSGVVPLRIFDPVGGVAALGAANADELNPAVLSTAFGNVVADGAGDGVVTRSGYIFKIFLPDATAGGVTQGLGEAAAGGAGAVLPSADNCEILWCAYAWPLSVNQTGNRVFFMNQEGDLLQTLNRAGAATQYDGMNAAPAFDAVYQIAGDMGSPLGINGAAVGPVDNNVWTPVQ
jgi:prepilin-type N-terminal cleavage/methylation domain-containing protein